MILAFEIFCWTVNGIFAVGGLWSLWRFFGD